MIIRKHNIVLQITETSCIKTDINIVCNDYLTNAFDIKIFDNLSEIDYSQIDHATILFAKPDGTFVQGDLTKTASGFTYTVGTNNIAAPGNVVVSVQLYGSNGERITTSRFQFLVIPDLINASAVESTSEFDVLEKLKQEVESIDVVSLTNKVGTGTLNTAAKNCVGGINELSTKIESHLSDNAAHGIGPHKSQTVFQTKVVDIDMSTTASGAQITVSGLAGLPKKIDAKMCRYDGSDTGESKGTWTQDGIQGCIYADVTNGKKKNEYGSSFYYLNSGSGMSFYGGLSDVTNGSFKVNVSKFGSPSGTLRLYFTCSYHS